MQVFGGYGFCSDYPVEQMMRNSKILCIFEGANGIQGIDLVMRKLLMNPGQLNYNVFKKRIQAAVDAAYKNGVDDAYIEPVERALERLDEYVIRMKEWSGKFMFGQVLSGATQFRKAVYMLAIAWMHVWSDQILAELPTGCPGILITQHMPEHFTEAFANRVNGKSRLFVKEATHGDRLLTDMALIAPGGKHMLLMSDRNGYWVEINDGPPVNRHRPSVDVLFRSVSKYAGD